MAKTKHTPPPWKVRDLAVWSIEGKVLDSVSGDLDQIEADLQLAAASPDLLSALEVAINSGRSWHGISAARAAIAKARGET